MRTALALAFVVGCGTDKDTTTVDTETVVVPTGETGGPVEEDLTGNDGSILLRQFEDDARNSGGFVAVGLFLADDGGVLNTPGCLFFGDACLTDYPAVGYSVDGESSFAWYYGADWLDAGQMITVGDTTLTDEFNGPVRYYVGYTSSFGPGDGAITLDGDLAPYAGTADFTYPSVVEVTSPDPSSLLVVGAESTALDLTWTAGGVGDLLVASGDRVLNLDDDGAESVPWADLGLTFEGPLATAYVQVMRSTFADVDAGGNSVKVLAQSVQGVFVTYLDETGRTELIDGYNVAEDCESAKELAPLAPGSYWGNSTDNSDDHNMPLYNDLFGWDSQGNDKVVPVALAAGQTLSVTYRQATDGSVYILPDSCDVDDVLDGADFAYYIDLEEFDYTSSTDQVVYLVLDGYFLGGDYLTLDFTVE